MAELPDPQTNPLPPNEKIAKQVVTDAVGNLNSIDLGSLDMGEVFGLVMAYTALYPILKNHGVTEVDRNGSGG